MAQRSARTSAFPRSTRAIHADSLAPGLAILVTLMVLLVAGILWVVLFQIPFYETSQSAHVTPDAMVVADFPQDMLAQIEVGQDALFVPVSETGSQPGASNALTATVVEVDPEDGQVWLLLTVDRATQSQLDADMPGQVHVVVRKQSPFSLIVEAAGMGSSA